MQISLFLNHLNCKFLNEAIVFCSECRVHIQLEEHILQQQEQPSFNYPGHCFAVLSSRRRLCLLINVDFCRMFKNPQLFHSLSLTLPPLLFFLFYFCDSPLYE